MRVGLSLQERLAVLVVAALLPLSGLSVWIAMREVREATDAAHARLQAAASLVAANQNRTIDGAEVLLGAIAAMEQMRAPERHNCESYFEALRARYPAYSSIGILDPQGQVLCTAGDFRASDHSYFARAIAERRFVMGAPVTGSASGRPGIPFAQPVLDGERIAAVAFATVDLDAASARIARPELSQAVDVSVTDRRGTVLLSHPPLRAGMQPAAANSVVVDAARRLATGVGEWTDPAGERRILAFAPTREVAGEGLLAVASIDRAEVSGASIGSLRGELIAIAATLLAGLVAAWWIGGRAVVRPAKRILGAVRRLEQGLLDARVPMAHGVPQRGEFARIGAAFNLMAESLQLRQLDLENELGRSRSAYAVLEQVLNTMQEALMAMDGRAELLLSNEAARRLFPLDQPVSPEGRPALWGLYRPDRTTLFEVAELPLARALRGESGRNFTMFVRNQQVPQGRLLQVSYQPLKGEQGITAALVVYHDVTELQRLQSDQAVQFEQLRETQRKLVEAQRIGGIGNWELDLATGKLWWSDEVYELFGVARAQFDPTLEAFEGRVHPEDRRLLKPARDTALRDGQSMGVEYRIVKPDGSVAWMHEIGEARRDEAGEPVWFGGLVQDITARKRNERALQDSQRELHDYTQMLQRAAEAALAITSLPTLPETMQQLAEEARRVIPAHMSVVSLTHSADWGQVIFSKSFSPKYDRWREFATPPDGTGIYSQVCESNQPLRLTHEALLRHPRGRGFGAHAGEHPPIRGLLAVPLVGRGGENIGLMQISDKLEGDFTERDEYVAVELAQIASIAIENARLFAEIRDLNAGLEQRIAERTAELTRQEQLFRTLAEQAPEVVWNVDATGNHLTFVNRAWCELVGGTPEDWIGRSGRETIHPDDVEAVSAKWRHSRQALSIFAGERRLRARDGTYHTMSFKGAPVLDADGKVAFWVGIETDITSLKAIERALRGSNQELEAFSYSVSHDLRAPLGAIAGFSKALAMKIEGQADERSLHYLSRIQAGVLKMEQLIDALLSLAKVARARLDWSTVDMAAIAREVFEDLRTQHPGRDVEVVVHEGLAAHGDPRMMRVLLQNVLGNAWKFTSHRERARIEFGRQSEGGVFYVSDNGVGFDMAYASKLFVAFQRLHTDAEFPGTGIGLATVRRIVARHQGKVWAESQPGDHTTFFFTLSDVAPPAWLATDAER